MKKKVLIVFYPEEFKINEYEVFGIARTKYIKKELDAQKFEQLEKYFQEVKPDIVINCIGILVAKSNSDLTTAIMMNSYFLSELGNKLIHISTDCVFSGKSGRYKEDSFRDGDDNYASFG